MATQAAARETQTVALIEEALALHREGRLAEAERIYDVILAAEPDHFAALHLSGLLHYQQGHLGEALHRIAAALKCGPGSFDALIDHATILESLGQSEQALAEFDGLLPICDDARLHYNRGNSLKRLGRHAEALASYDRALALDPAMSPAHHNRGSVLAALGRYREALACFDHALALATGSAAVVEALNNRGKLLIKLKRYEAAQANDDNLFELEPNHAEALTRRGLVMAEHGRFDEALALHRRALAVEPQLVDAHLNSGNVLIALNRFADALTCFTAGAALDPKNPTANFNGALVRLYLGDFRAGWLGYERRWDVGEYAASRPNYPKPMWRGENGLAGKTVLLCAEQGMGDAIQFVRYAPMVAARGAKVLVGVHPPLTALLASVPGVAQVITDGANLPDFDLFCPLLSLPMVFGTELSTIPSQVPYLAPDPERIVKWRARLPQTGRMRVGICWAGTSLHPNNRNRSIALSRFAALFTVPNLDFISLQKDCSAADAEILRAHNVIEIGSGLEDFADTAAVVAMVDLVIAVDTSVAHLAGAMAKAVAVLIPFSPDFRWMAERTDSPWYPTMRLFRQSAIGDWDTPLARLRGELEGVAARRAGLR